MSFSGCQETFATERRPRERFLQLLLLTERKRNLKTQIEGARLINLHDLPTLLSSARNAHILLAALNEVGIDTFTYKLWRLLQ
jgi:hypothetical protein